MKLVLDFDRVLFDHDTLKRVMKENDLEHLYAKPELWDELHPGDFFYPDVQDFLAQYPKEQMIVLSAYIARIGPEAEPYQYRKVMESGIGENVGEIIIMDGAKAPFVCKYANEKAYFVDDKRLYVEEVHHACPEVTSIQLLRPNAERTKNDATEPDASLGIPVVKDLRGVSAIING